MNIDEIKILDIYEDTINYKMKDRKFIEIVKEYETTGIVRALRLYNGVLVSGLKTYYAYRNILGVNEVPVIHLNIDELTSKEIKLLNISKNDLFAYKETGTVFIKSIDDIKITEFTRRSTLAGKKSPRKNVKKYLKKGILPLRLFDGYLISTETEYYIYKNILQLKNVPVIEVGGTSLTTKEINKLKNGFFDKHHEYEQLSIENN